MQRRTRQVGSAPAGATISCWSALRTPVATELEPHLAHSHFGKGRGHDWIISGETEQPFRDVVPNNELDQLRFGYYLRKSGVERLLQFGEFVGRERSDAAGYCHGRLPDLRTRALVLMGHASLAPLRAELAPLGALALLTTGQTSQRRPLSRRLSLFRLYPLETVGQPPTRAARGLVAGSSSGD